MKSIFYELFRERERETVMQQANVINEKKKLLRSEAWKFKWQ